MKVISLNHFCCIKQASIVCDVTMLMIWRARAFLTVKYEKKIFRCQLVHRLQHNPKQHI